MLGFNLGIESSTSANIWLSNGRQVCSSCDLCLTGFESPCWVLYLFRLPFLGSDIPFHFQKTWIVDVRTTWDQ